MLALLLYHSARPFDLEVWHVKNDTASLTLQLLGNLLTPWRLPLLFMISGLGTSYALGVRTAGRYVADRTTRLLIPLVAGMLLVVPPQVYLERIGTWMPLRMSPFDFHGSFLEFYPHIFDGIYPRGNFSWHHLWFLVYLFLFSLLALPLALHLRTDAGRRRADALVQWLARGRRIFLLMAPLAVIHVALRGRFPPTLALVGDWWNLAHYFVVFLLGLVCLGRPAFTEACERNRHVALVLFLLVAPARAWVGFTVGPVQPYSAVYVALLVARAITEWSALVAVIGYASRHLSAPRRWLAWAGDRVYPFYIWHQTVIVAVAFWIVQWSGGPIVKFVLVTAISLVLTLVVCELVRLTPVTRVLFGIKSRAAA